MKNTYCSPDVHSTNAILKKKNVDLSQAIVSLLLVLIPISLCISQELPKVVPPSPEAASLFKYLDYPVDYATGIPQINIPLYEVKSGSLTLPISINYHSSGRKVYDETGAIGLGWTLMAGGMISRTIYGEPDDNDFVVKFPTPWKKASEINSGTIADADFLEGIHETHYPLPWYDTEYDIFSYSANSISGKFILRDENNVKVPVLIPKKPYKVECHKANAQYNINYFDYISIIDDGGNTYRFGKSLKDGTEYHETSDGVGKNSWMLTEIISADKVDTIFFKYQSFSKSKRTVSQLTTVTDKYDNCLNPNGSVGLDVPPFTETDQLGTFQDGISIIQRITEIKFRNGRVKFNLENGGDMILSMQIENGKTEIIRIVEFNQTLQDLLSDGNAPTKKLELLKVKDAHNNTSDIYKFDYYPTVYPSVPNVVDGRFRDLWGYYNASGYVGMRPLIENIDVYHPQSGLAFITIGDGLANTIRKPGEAIKSGVLKKITFPTGGSKEFIYEHNLYDNHNEPNATLAGPGLRLYQTITSDGQGYNSTKTYKYGIAESGFGKLPLIPSKFNMSYETQHQNYLLEGYHVAIGVFITAKEVFFRKRVFSADVLPIFSEFHQLPVYYEEVSEYHGTPTDNIGKTVYKYDMGNQMAFAASVDGLFLNSQINHWKQSSMIEKRDYKNTGGSYGLIRRTNHTYWETTYDNEKLWGLRVGKFIFPTPDYVVDVQDIIPGYYQVPSYWPQWLSQNEGAGCGAQFSNTGVFKFSDYTISVGKKELIQTSETTYHDNGTSLQTVTDYTYNANHLISSTSVKGSDNSILLTENKYPFDFIATPVYADMVNRNMLNFEVEVSNFRNGLPNFSKKTTYRDWGNNIITPEIVSTRQGSLPYEPRLVFHSYDAVGNMQSVSKDNGPKLTYLYGYGATLPIAEVNNASQNQIFYTSFEDQEGNSGENDAKTGRKSRTGGYVKTLTGLPNGSYNLTYFQKSSDVWNLVQQNNIAITSGTFTINLAGQVDEIRFFPVGSSMTTYTYDILEGLTSVTDPNNITSFYERDRFLRLIKIRDQHKNALRQFDYHYKEN